MSKVSYNAANLKNGILVTSCWASKNSMDTE